jgi:hypothetical protein
MQRNINDNNTGVHRHWIPPTEEDADDQMFTGEKSEFGMMEFSDPRAQVAFKHLENNYKKMLDLKRAYDTQELLRKMRVDLRREYMTRKKQVKRLQLVAAVDFRNAHCVFEQHHRMNTFGEFKFGVSGVDISAPVVSQIQLPSGETVDLKTFNSALEFDKLCQMHKMIQQRLEEEEEEDDGNDTPPCLYRPDRAAFGGCYGFYDEEEQQDEPEQEPEESEQLQQEPEQLQQEPEQLQQEPEQLQEEPDEEEQQDDNHVPTPVCVDYRLERPGNSTKVKKPTAKKHAATKKHAAALVKKQKFVPFQIEFNVNHASNREMLPASKIEIDMPKKNLQNASREDKKLHNQKLKRIHTEQKIRHCC